MKVFGHDKRDDMLIMLLEEQMKRNTNLDLKMREIMGVNYNYNDGLALLTINLIIAMETKENEV